MKAALKRLVGRLLRPLLDWCSHQLDGIRASLDVLVEGQAELVRSNREAVAERDAGLDVVSRAVGVQAATLESIRAEQERLADEVRELSRRLGPSDGDHVGP